MSAGTANAFQPEDLQLLAWKFLDGCASDDEQRQLTGCLNDDADARSIYLQCVQLHVDLLAHFGGLPTAKILDKAMGKSPAKPAMPVTLPLVSPLPSMNMPSPF